jgi:hypothetical protein
MARRRKTTEPAGDARPGKQVASEMLPTRYSRSEITGGDILRRSINDYAKASPADASGVGTIGYNLHSMSRT